MLFVGFIIISHNYYYHISSSQKKHMMFNLVVELHSEIIRNIHEL